MVRALAAMQNRIDDPLPRVEAAEEPAADGEQPPAADAAPEMVVPIRRASEQHADVRRAEGDDNLSINIQNTDIRAVLEMISRETGLNIIASRKVTGAVTANLTGVDLEPALAAILKSTGFAAAREGNIIYIGEPTDLQLMN